MQFDIKIYFANFINGILISISAAPAYDEDELDDPFTAEGDNLQLCLEPLAVAYYFLTVCNVASISHKDFES